MRILITGGAGFIGTSIALTIKKKYPHYTIIVFDNLKRRGSELNLNEFREFGIEFIHGDIRNSEDFSTVGPFDVLIEASAEPSVMSGINSDPTYVINNNLFGSINCFNACLRNKARLVFLSTSRVYPIQKIENAEFTEDTTRFCFAKKQTEIGISALGISESLSLLGSRSFYGTTKLSSELFIQEYETYYNLKASIIRYGVIAGPRQMGKTDQGVVTLWMASHFWKKQLKYIGYNGTGKQVRDILHIDDLVDLIDIQLHATEKFNGKIFNAGGGLNSSASLLELTTLCEQITGNKIKIDGDMNNRPADLRIYVTDNTKITTEIGWSPKYTTEKVLIDIYDWLLKNENQLKTILN